MINNILNFLLTFMAACIFQALALAGWEGTQHQMITFFGSRIGIVWFGISLAFMLAICVTWMLRRKNPVAKNVAGSSVLTADRIRKLTQKGNYAQVYRELAEVPQQQLAALLGGSAAIEVQPGLARHSAVVRAERQFVAFDLHVPPQASLTYQSWFGGLPLVPKNFVWPHYQSKSGVSIPLAFFLQVDCSQISKEAGLDLMPANGLLQFYIDTAESLGKAFAIRYFDEPTHSLSIATMPSSLPPLFNAQGNPWTLDLPDAASLTPQLFPRWTFDLVSLQIPAAYFEQDDDERSYWNFPSEHECESFDWSDQIQIQVDVPVQPPSPIARPFPDFPHDWRAVLISCTTLLKEIRHPTPQADKNKVAEATSHAVKWLEMARQHDLHVALSQTQSDEFWALIERNNAHLYMGRSAREAAAATLSDPLGRGVALSVQGTELARGQKQFPVFSHGRLRVNSPNRLLSAGSDVQGMSEEIASDHIMLLEVSSDHLLGLEIGDGVLQFWIKPEHLLAKRFDQVILLAGAY